MPALDTGRYIITNVKYGNLAVLPDANDESDVVAGVQENNPGEKVCRCTFCVVHVAYRLIQWNVTLLNNRKFTIKNPALTILPAVRRAPRKETPSLDESAINNGSSGRRGLKVDTRRLIYSALHCWRLTLKFLSISPTDGDVFWGLPDGESETPVGLLSSALRR